MPRPRALVTGAHGFLGRHIARSLQSNGYEVVGMGHGKWVESGFRDWGMSEWYEMEISLEGLTSAGVRPDLIVHCAGGGRVAQAFASPYDDFHKSVHSTLAVLEFVRVAARNGRVVFPSSAAVYGEVDRLPIDEQFPLRPVSPYGIHKLICEQLCRSYAKNFDINVAVVRLFSLYGTGLRKQLLWDACNAYARGEGTFSGSGQELRDWLHVEDAATLIERAAGIASTLCPIVNGGGGVGVSITAILEELFHNLGGQLRPQFSGLLRQGDPTCYVADIHLARDLGWQPSIQWRDGVRMYAEWFNGGCR